MLNNLANSSENKEEYENIYKAVLIFPKNVTARKIFVNAFVIKSALYQKYNFVSNTKPICIMEHLYYYLLKHSGP